MPERSQYKRIATNATTTVRDGAAGLERITINAPGTAWGVAIHDGTDDAAPQVGYLQPSAPGSHEFALRLSKGLTIKTTGTTPGDLTIVFPY